MAAAARPGPPEARDARVPCPLCGGLIHPIAGKCKHCKADLSAYRAARPAANTPLPALHPGGSAAPAHAVPLPPAAHAVLPPRPTTRVATEVGGSAWRSWPVVVIVVAMMAIVAAVVLMVWPTSRGDTGKHTLQPPPAPERMDTQTPPVTPPAPRVDHAAPRSDAPADPPAGPHASIPPQRDPAGDPSASDDLDDPGSAPPADPRGGHAALTFNGTSVAQVALLARMCRKLVKCGTTDDMMRSVCDQVASLPADPPAGCPAATRCIRHIDAMGCGGQLNPTQLGEQILQLADCVDAMGC